jgi:hypothetical protein
MKPTKSNKDFAIARILLVAAAVIIFLGSLFLLPAGSVACNGANCAMAMSPYHYAPLMVGSMVALLGFAYAYMGMRKNFTTTTYA